MRSRYWSIKFSNTEVFTGGRLGMDLRSKKQHGFDKYFVGFEWFYLLLVDGQIANCRGAELRKAGFQFCRRIQGAALYLREVLLVSVRWERHCEMVGEDNSNVWECRKTLPCLHRNSIDRVLELEELSHVQGFQF